MDKWYEVSVTAIKYVNRVVEAENEDDALNKVLATINYDAIDDDICIQEIED